MRKIHRLALGLALVSVWSCKESAPRPDETARKGDSTQVAPRNPSDTSFSQAEIRRSGARTPESTAVEAPVKTDSVASPQPAPVAKAPQPAQPVAAPAEPAPAPAPKAPVVSAPAPTPPPVASGGEGPGSEGEWVLQINIHKSEAEARAQVQKLADQGIAAYAIPVPTGETRLSGDYWRVRVGRFKERAKAQAWGEANIVPRGLKFWVDKKSNENRSAGNP